MRVLIVLLALTSATAFADYGYTLIGGRAPINNPSFTGLTTIGTLGSTTTHIVNGNLNIVGGAGSVAGNQYTGLQLHSETATGFVGIDWFNSTGTRNFELYGNFDSGNEYVGFASDVNSILNLYRDRSIEFPALTASTVPYLDANKKIVSSAVTPTQLGLVGNLELHNADDWRLNSIHGAQMIDFYDDNAGYTSIEMATDVSTGGNDVQLGGEGDVAYPFKMNARGIVLGQEDSDTLLTAPLGVVMAKSITTPAAPPSGFSYFYFKSDGAYIMGHDGTEKKITTVP